MRENPSMNTEPNNQTPSQDYFSKIAFWKVGIIEVLLVGIVLALLFGTLNYFNILPISDVFPKYLSFLPRQQLEKNEPITLNKTIAPLNKSEADTALNALMDFLPQVINRQLLPIKSGISISQYGKINNFNAQWETTNVIFTLSQNQTYLESINLYITNEEESPMNVDTAQNLVLETFSLTPKGTWGCKIITSATYCENFWKEPTNYSMGIGIFEPSALKDNKKAKVIFLCQHDKNSQSYSWKSCIPEFADSGIE